MILGAGDNPLSAVYAGVVADAAIMAADDRRSEGEAFNITSHGPITQREFLNLFASALGLPPVTRHVPYSLAFTGGFLLELQDRLLRRSRPPRITRYGAWLLGRHLEYSTEKARTRLGWLPARGYRESIERTVQWFLDRGNQNGTFEVPGLLPGPAAGGAAGLPAAGAGPRSRHGEHAAKPEVSEPFLG